MGITTPMIDAGLWLGRSRSYLNHSPAEDTETDLSDLPLQSPSHNKASSTTSQLSLRKLPKTLFSAIKTVLD
jgi:hypothetical protein